MVKIEFSDIGLIGLAVMGQNLVLNMLDHKFKVCVFNRTVSKVDEFLARESARENLDGAKTIAEFVSGLKKPRIAMMLVKAGPAVDDFIEQLLPHLDAGDVIIDGGNSEFVDTERRCKYLDEKSILYVGSGVSGGEEGARLGPSLMPGGNPKAWKHIKPIFQAISAKVASGEPCCDWAGDGGAGHFVKMVHNGIEYGDMQLIAEAYQLLDKQLHLPYDEMSKIFGEWDKGELESYLIQITSELLAYKDDTGAHLVEKIRDCSGQKGTGKWTTISGLERGCPITLIAESVFSRTLSSFKDLRVAASKVFPKPEASTSSATLLPQVTKTEAIEDIRRALYASKIISYTQGFMLLQKAKEDYGWNLNLGGIAMMWRGGCIIRSRFLGKIKEAFENNPKLNNLLLDPFFKDVIAKCQSSWRKVVVRSALDGYASPAFCSALAFYDGLRCPRLPANLIQAQRDYFGAHQYELEGKPGVYIHTDWTGRGGTTAASTYNA